MVTATSQYIKINELYGMLEGSTTLSAAKAVYAGSTPSKRVWAGSKIVWDVWDTTLSADNFEIPATGGNVEDYVEIISKMTSAEGENENISYSLNITSISPNTTTSSKTHNIVITQELTGESIIIVCTQEANVQLNVSYGTPTVVDTATEIIEAAGGSTVLLVQYSQIKTTYYANGTSSNETIRGNTVATNIKGVVSVSGATTDGQYIEIGSAKDNTYTSDRTIYTITGYTFEANGKSKTVTNASIAVKQEANNLSTSYSSYTITCSTTASTVSAEPSTFNVTVGCYRTKYLSWTSGSESSETEYGKVTMSGDNCSCSPTSYTSNSSSPTGTIKVTTNENITFSSRKCTVYATDPNGKSKSISVTQEPVSFTFVADETEYDANATVNTVNIVIESTRNNKPWGIASSNVSISPSNVATVGTITSSGSNYTIPISLKENTGSTRTITVTITQPSSNDTKTITINQASGVVKEVAGINLYECAYTDETATKVSYNFTVTAEDTNKYSGGSVGSVKVALNTMPNGSGTVVAGPTTLASSLTVSAGTESSAFSGTFTVPSQYSGGVYLIIYLNNKIADYSDIEEIIPE